MPLPLTIYLALAAPAPDLEAKVKAIFEEHCTACHDTGGEEPVLAGAPSRLKSVKSKATGKPIVAAGDPDGSYLLAKLNGKNISGDVMPQGGDPLPAAQLAGRYYELAVARGDPRYIGYADAVLAPFARDRTPAVLTVRGQLRQYRHDFDGALQDFAAALDADPQFASAHAWRGAIFLVQANYAAAKSECDALLALDRPTLYGGCIGLVLAYGGRMDAGYAALQRALDGTRDPGNRLWLLTRLGEVQLGHSPCGFAACHRRFAAQVIERRISWSKRQRRAASLASPR